MLKQLLGEIDGFGKSSMDGLHSLFESQMNDLTMRAQNYKEQITNPSSYFYATPSFKVGVKGQLNSNKKPFPFSFNSGSTKKTPLKSPPHLHKTPLGSPHSFRKQTPLGTRNFEQELNIQPHNVNISHSPLFKFVKSPILMTSGGNKKKRKSSSVSKRNPLSSPQMPDSTVELPKEIEFYAPIPPLEFDKDLGLDKDDDMDTEPIKPIEPILMNKKNSVMSVDMELGEPTRSEENDRPILSPPPQTIELLQQLQEPQQLSRENSIQQPVVIPPSTLFQLPKVKEEPISDEEEQIVVKKSRQPKRKPKLPTVQQNNVSEPIHDTTTLPPVTVQEPPKEPEIIVIDDAKSDVTEQLSCLLISEALKENEKNEDACEHSFIPVQSFIIKKESDSPELVNKTFNRTCLDEMNISMIQPIEEERKQSEFSFLSKTKLFQETHDDLSDDSILCFSASDDDLFEDDKEHENDVCVKINFAPPPVVNIFERQQTVHIPNPFSNLKKTNSAEAVKVTSLQEKIKSLKSDPCIPSIHSLIQKADERPSLQLSEPPCTPTRTPGSLSGAIEKLGQLSIHNKIDVMFSSPEVELSPPPFDSVPDFSSPKYSSLQHIKVKTEITTPKQEPTKEALTPKNEMQLSTPPTINAIKEPPTVSHHGKYKPFTPKFMEQRPTVGDIPYEDPFATLKRDSIDIIDEENEHKRKFTNKVSTESNDQKRLKLSETNRISISSVSSASSISSFHSNASIGESVSHGGGNIVSNILTGVKSFVFKTAHNKNKSSVGASKKAISSLKLAEAAKKKEEEKKNAKKEKLEKQLALQKKKKEQEDKLKEDSKKQTKLVKPTTTSSTNTSQKSIVEGLALASGSRCSNTSSSNSTNKKQIGPMNKPQPPKKQTTLKPLPVIPEPRVSSYELSDEYDSSEDEEIAKRRRQHKKIPSWAQGETLKKNIIRTTKIDPDRIFGIVKSCNLEDIFKGTTNQVMINRFRQRTSSSNWTADHFTLEEEQEYREEMGFTL